MLSNPTQFWQFSKPANKLTPLSDYSEFIVKGTIFNLSNLIVDGGLIVQLPEYNVEVNMPQLTTNAIQVYFKENLHLPVDDNSLTLVRVSPTKHFRTNARITTINKICKSTEILSYSFYYNNVLTTIKNDAFKNLPNLLRANNCFENCSNLVSIPEAMFSGCTKLYDLNNCFKNCSSLTTTNNVFYNLPALQACHFTFGSCYALTEATVNLSKTLTGDVSLMDCFKGCFKLSKVTFSNISTVSNFTDTFANCGFTALNSSTFVADSPIRATTLSGMFLQNFKLTSISGMFNDVVNEAWFPQMFWNCRTLETVSNSFRNIRPKSLVNLFENCYKLRQTILFDGQEAWVKFVNIPKNAMYRSCTSIPNFGSLPAEVR